MAHQHRHGWHDKRALQRESSDDPDPVALLEHEPPPDRWREPPEPDTPTAASCGFVLPAGQNGPTS